MKKELTLDELLRDPIVLTVMRADRVHPDHLRRKLRQVGDHFINNVDGKAVPARFTGKPQGGACTW